MSSSTRCELGQRSARAREVLGVELPAHLLRERREAGLLVQCGAHPRFEVPRRGTVHARDLHVAAERDRADAVLDPLAPELHDRGREPDVELARLDADRERGDEVAQLVHQDEEREADVRRRARSCDRKPLVSELACGSVGLEQIVEVACRRTVGARERVGTTSAMPRNGSRPARKAATATSFAAL